jgi:Rrf2 family protein
MSSSTNTQFAVAIHIAAMLANADDALLSSEQMAASIATNPVHVRRILGHLRRAGLVSSRPGPNGGWWLEREPESMSLADLWRAIYAEAPLLPIHDDTNPDCPVGRNIQGTLGRVRSRLVRSVEEELGSITVAEILADALGARRLGRAA